MRLALRVLGAVLVVITLLFPWPATASAFGPPTGRTHQFCTYDAPIYDAPASYSAIERGPPVAAYVPDFAQSANDLRSNGASARPGGSTTRDSYDYDTTATPLQVDNSAGATNGLAEGASRAIASPQRWRVAAKAEVPLIKAGSAGGESAGKVFPQAVKDAARAENPGTCVFCRMDTKGQVDHAIPRARGGNATLDNAQIACPWCNASKGARDFPVNPPPGFRGDWPPAWWGLP